jgi:hypothetical protein
MLAVPGCTLLVDRSGDQCVHDSDCYHFDATYPVCRAGSCVSSGLGPPGCFFGNAQTHQELETQCSTSDCIPFDNCARLKICDGGSLPVLIDPLEKQ